jgi:hypothetical protein
LPSVATATVVIGSPPATNIPNSRTSELNGNMVAASNDPINRPIYPNSRSDSIFIELLAVKIVGQI